MRSGSGIGVNRRPNLEGEVAMIVKDIRQGISA